MLKKQTFSLYCCIALSRYRYLSKIVLLFRLLEVGSLLDIIKHKMKSTDCKVSTLFYSL
jgi:hypothetical protein